jgi:hypothetical protein
MKKSEDVATKRNPLQSTNWHKQSELKATPDRKKEAKV